MRLKLFVVLVVTLGYLTVLLACNRTPTASLTQDSNTKANSNAAANTNSAAPGSSNTTASSNAAPPATDGGNPPHAVDTSGHVIPNASATQPDKPIILAKDSENTKANSGELKPEAAFDHVKHSTLPEYSLDGKTVAACVDCHHTDQAAAPKGQEFLKKFERKETLTAKQLEASKEPVKSCRACHFQASAEETDEYPPKSVTYPPEMNRPPSGKLTNEIAYHLNCNTCHDTAKKRDPKTKAPQACADCHTAK